MHFRILIMKHLMNYKDITLKSINKDVLNFHNLLLNKIYYNKKDIKF